METINLDTAEYGAIIRFAEAHGFRKSSAAVAREAEEGSVGQYGLTLDEACDFIRANGLNSEMPISIAAATLGARGGAATKGVSTPRKARSSRANGKLGGRPRDQRRWQIVSDYIANDPSPYTTKQLLDYAEQCNRENRNDPDWTPFELVDAFTEIHDLSHQRGDDGFIAAVPYPKKTD